MLVHSVRWQCVWSVDPWRMLEQSSSGPGFWWTLVDPSTTVSTGPLSRRDTRVRYQEVLAEGGFDFRGDVSLSLVTSVVAQVERAPHWSTKVCKFRAFCEVDRVPFHFFRQPCFSWTTQGDALWR